MLGPLHDEAADAGDRLAEDDQPRRVLHEQLGSPRDEDRHERIGAMVHETPHDEPTPRRGACLPSAIDFRRSAIDSGQNSGRS